MNQPVRIPSISALAGALRDAETDAEFLEAWLPDPPEDHEDPPDPRPELEHVIRELREIAGRLERLAPSEPSGPDPVNPRRYRGARRSPGEAPCKPRVTVHEISAEYGYVERQVGNLESRNDIHDHSPTGFDWGHMGSGPAQLALALLADATGDDEYARTHHLGFKRDVVRHIKSREWDMEGDGIAAWVADHP